MKYLADCGRNQLGGTQHEYEGSPVQGQIVPSKGEWRGSMQTIMANVPVMDSEEGLSDAPVAGKRASRANAWKQSAFASIPSVSRLMTVGYSFSDQALAVGGMFLINIALARTQSKEEYGMFALSYSIYTFLTGLHNASILEPFTVYGSGRYQGRFSEYLRLMTRANVQLGLLLSGMLLLVWLALWWVAPQYASRALLGLGLTVGALLSGLFLRRAFYVQRQPRFAARASLVFFLTVCAGLWLSVRGNVLSGFSVFLILALGWIVAGVGLGNKLALGHPAKSFLDSEPRYWREHWKYSKWVFATAFVFQFTTQGYYWLVAGFLSVKQVADLRVMNLMIGPIDQAFIALSFLVLPVLAARYADGKMQEFFSLQKRYGMGVLAATGLFVVAVRMAGRPVMHMLYAGKFDDLVPLLYVLAFSPLIMGIGNTMSLGLNAAEKPKLVFFAYVSSGAVTFLAGIPLMISFGLRGAVYGMLLSVAAYSIALGVGYFLVVYRGAHRWSLP